MPKTAKIDDEIGGREVHEDQTAPANSKGARLRQFLDRAMNLQREIDDTMNEAKRECAPLRDDMKELKKEAAAAGFSAKEFAALLRKERYEYKAEHAADSLDTEQRERYDDMLHSLGELADTPLGQAAAAKHPDAPREGAAAH